MDKNKIIHKVGDIVVFSVSNLTTYYTGVISKITGDFIVFGYIEARGTNKIVPNAEFPIIEINDMYGALSDGEIEKFTNDVKNYMCLTAKDSINKIYKYNRFYNDINALIDKSDIDFEIATSIKNHIKTLYKTYNLNINIK